jgi:L-alanine-DL-glutamate epimerase-like enolase superfamily enzyme
MKIVRIGSQVVRLPVEEPLAGGPAYSRSNNLFVTVRLETEDGIEGLGVTFFGGMLSKTLKCAVEQLGEVIIGADRFRLIR